jgi:electron transport complex protein RnfB
LIAGIILTLAAKFMAVEVDEKAANLREVMPGANCGACGFAGCDAYADALAEDNTIKGNLCTPGGSAVAKAIGEILGIDVEELESRYAIVRCSGTYDKTQYVMDFQGIQSCAANKMFYRGRGACSHACLGFGDCVKECDYGAITMVDGVASIDKNKCVACELCVKSCPNHLITMVPSKLTTYVACSNTDKPAKTRQICAAGCIGCKKCEKACKFDAIHVTDFLAVIDPEKCKNCGMCIKVCPVDVIKSNKPVKPKILARDQVAQAQ